METTAATTDVTTDAMSVAKVDMKLEVVAIPVSDVDRATAFYDETRVETGRHAARLRCRPVHAARLGVLDPVRHEPHVGRARVGPGPVPDRLRHRRRPRTPGCRRYRGERGLPPGRRRSGQRSCDPGDTPATAPCRSFSDPDGNRWLLQEVTTRLPGRVDPAATSFGSASDLDAALVRAATAHGEHEKRMGGEYDVNWPTWYAAYMVAEQAGTELPT